MPWLASLSSDLLCSRGKLETWYRNSRNIDLWIINISHEPKLAGMICSLLPIYKYSLNNCRPRFKLWICIYSQLRTTTMNKWMFLQRLQAQPKDNICQQSKMIHNEQFHIHIIRCCLLCVASQPSQCFLSWSAKCLLFLVHPEKGPTTSPAGCSWCQSHTAMCFLYTYIHDGTATLVIGIYDYYHRTS